MMVAPARLLVVDDEPHIRTALTRAFRMMGHEVVAASDGDTALGVLTEQPFHLVVLDLVLPDRCGVEVMQEAQKLQENLLVVVLTGQATIESAIAAVKAGAVDYLLKPASIKSIVETVSRALKKQTNELQREQLVRILIDTASALRLQEDDTPEEPVESEPVSPSSPPLLSSGQFVLNPGRRAVRFTHSSSEVELTEGEMSILVGLMAIPHQVRSCRELVFAAWGDELEESKAQSLIRPYIFRLRQKLEQDPDHPKMIRTVRGRGYVLLS